MRNSRTNTCERVPVMYKRGGQYHSDTVNDCCDDGQGVVPTKSFSEATLSLDQSVFSREPSAVLRPSCCLTITTKVKGIFRWDVGYLTYIIRPGG